MRLRLAVALFAGLLALGAAAPAAAGAPDGRETAAPLEPARRFCTPTSCGPRPATPLASAGAFGAAVLLAAALARRSRPPRS